MLDTELILEKYVDSPIVLRINENNMLECRGVTIADNVIFFDAVTDINSAVHGVILNSEGQILYFKLAGGLPVSKVIASGVQESALKHISITECDGILHIFIIKSEKNLSMYHYRTQSGSWLRSGTKSFVVDAEYMSSCPCMGGKFAVLMNIDGRERLFIESSGRFQEVQCVNIPSGYGDMSIVYNNNMLEFVADYGESGLGVIELYDFGSQIQDEKSFEIKSKNMNKEDNMANGNIINSKYITDLQNNTEQVEKLSIEIEELREKLESIQNMIENAEKQYKYITSCRDAIRQHDTQLNQANIRIQEIINRLNGIAKR